jgi:hypothetical protein
MSSYVSFFTSNIIKLDMKGYYAFNEKPPGRSKIRKINILWILRAASSSYELPGPTPLPSLLQHQPRFLGHCSKIICNIA